MKAFIRAATAVASLGILFVVCAPARAGAQQPPQPTGAPAAAPPGDVQAVREQLEQLKKDYAALQQQYGERLQALEQRLSQLAGPPAAQPAPPVATEQAQTAPATSPAAPQVAPAAPAPPTLADQAAVAAVAAAAPTQTADVAQGGSAVPAGSSKVFNPDMSVIGNFVGVAGKNPLSTQSPLELSEAEASFQAIVDPYARADFFLAAGPEGLEIEEGFITFTSLPSSFLLKAGKMRAQFGKVNTLHTHAMPTADRPLVTQNLVGGEEGLSDSGLSLSRLIHNPFIFLEATGEVYASTSEVFQSDQRSRLTYVGRLRAYRDLTEATNIDLGTSVAFGPSEGLPEAAVPGLADPLSLDRRLIGVDASFRYRPLRRAIYQRLNLRSEFIWSRQERAFDTHANAFGAYGLGEYQFAQRWYAGARFDHSGRAFDGSLTDNGGSVFITFWPSEFSQVRGQYRRTRYAEDVTANEFLFQFNFAIGAHGAHVF
jgi:hypothetical protein